MLTIPLDENIDWFRVIVSLERGGYPIKEIAKHVGVHPRTVGYWKSGITSPKWEDGQSLLGLWVKITIGKNFPRR